MNVTDIESVRNKKNENNSVFVLSCPQGGIVHTVGIFSTFEKATKAKEFLVEKSMDLEDYAVAGTFDYFEIDIVKLDSCNYIDIKQF